jgi:hypothetical protein
MITSQYLNKINYSKIGLLIILGFGWMEKIFVWEGVPEGIYKMVETNILGYFELIVFILLIVKEKYGAILSFLIFLTTLSFLINGFSFSIAKDFAMLGISIDLTLKHWGKK